MKNPNFRIYFLLIMLFSAFTCTNQDKALHKKPKAQSVFRLDTLGEESYLIKVVHVPIEDEKGAKYELYAFHNSGNYYTKIYLVSNKYCIDSFLLQDDSQSLLRFDLLPSKKRIHAVYDVRSSGCTSYSYQVIIQLKNKRIFVPLLFSYESTEHCLMGDINSEYVDSIATKSILDVKLLDSTNICKFNILDYEKIYSRSGKPRVTQKKSVYTIPFNPETEVYCDSLKYFNFEYKNCNMEKKMLNGIYPVRQYGDDGDGGKYFEIFIGREWYIYLRGILSPQSDQCY